MTTVNTTKMKKPMIDKAFCHQSYQMNQKEVNVMSRNHFVALDCYRDCHPKCHRKQKRLRKRLSCNSRVFSSGYSAVKNSFASGYGSSCHLFSDPTLLHLLTSFGEPFVRTNSKHELSLDRQYIWHIR